MEYETSDTTTDKLLAQVLKKKTDLKEAKVTASILFVSNEEGPAVKRPGGIPTDGKIEVRNQKDRKQGSTDVRLLIDKAAWENASGGQREALLDHLLHHVEPRKDADGNLIMDSAGRPKLSKRVYDFHIAGFKDVIEEHGADAPEFIAAKEMNDTYGQLLLFAGNPQAVG